ncbi:hypothetical protein [Leifsonia virtsii]|uniref:Uncharacterized protein n=1 Tax=Leifsonia virtsii TaxID=3035915 RepID=A0ABT8J2Y8_9MICO|nr:hypothetical protein [Leifsonia virtsii]MDN4599456.1 hypothetical protein [Leifsonia virtsii]
MNEQTGVHRDAGSTRETILRPHRHLFLRGIVAVLALTTPVFAVLYWLTIPVGCWPFVLVAHLIVIALTITGVASFLNTTIVVGPAGVRERGFFGRTVRVAPGEPGAVIMVKVYEGSTLDVLPQLFVASAEGRLLIRMRGQFWSSEDMERVAEELDVPVTRPAEPMTPAQLRQTWPRLLYWFERVRFAR